MPGKDGQGRKRAKAEDQRRKRPKVGRKAKEGRKKWRPKKAKEGRQKGSLSKEGRPRKDRRKKSQGEKVKDGRKEGMKEGHEGAARSTAEGQKGENGGRGPCGHR